MNIEAQAELDRIVAIEPAALTDSDKGFLRSRRSYLSEEQKAVYADVLGDSQEEAPAEVPAEDEAEEAPVRRGRKTSV